MYLTSLPFDYISHLDHGDRVRAKRERTSGIRVRRPAPATRR
jgi:hypothetical protein